ncbi:MAG TPA: UrcA family protein [Steroidobacteraceae bacterium]|jgi:UrcA family protein
MNTLNTTPKTRRLGVSLWTALAGLSIAGSFGVANAAPVADDGVPTLAVKYDDLDLSTRDGAVALYQRIAAAAQLVCPDPQNTSIADVQTARSCRRVAVDRAVQAVHNPQLAALHSGLTHRG